LTQCKDGNLYGTTFEGGSREMGTAFRLTPEGTLTTLLEFNWTNGAYPAGPLTLGADGNFYGATMYGGAFEGTVFRMTPEGRLTTLAHFTARESGVRPYGDVIFGADGHLYGTTATGGNADSGVIFRLELGHDADGDGVVDEYDECPATPAGSVVNAQGCSIGQLVPCTGPRPGVRWQSRAQYLLAVARQTADFVSEELLTTEQGEEILGDAVRSDCGKKPKPKPVKRPPSKPKVRGWTWYR
jgi:uncharacterized repeat protein (TIGR03803 family)